MPTLYYFRAPNFDISADSPTAPKLGSIFASLKRLTSPINQDEYVFVPANLINSSDKVDFKDTSTRNLKTSVGINAGVTPGGFGVGSGELIYGFATDRKITYTCDLLETREFDPTIEFVQECVRTSTRVQEYIHESFLGNKTVYMVTGLKIATGLRSTSSANSEHTPSLKVVVSGQPFGIPVEAGPMAELKYGTGRDLQFAAAGQGSSSRVVFAYRAIKIRPRRDGTMKYKDISGGLYGLGDEPAEEEEEWEMEEMSEEDVARHVPEAELISVEHIHGES